MQDASTVWRDEGRDQGRHTLDAPPVAEACPGRILGFFLIDAQNKFNEENRMAIMWDVLFKWPSSAQFTFN